ncbi:MAG: 50S ribosomal protein L21 [Planctomycetaceae bacterium]|nr:50S ribosomal protein L21 [Planctomycetaceae bacterium]
MFAVFSDGSRQYRVQPGDVVVVDFRRDLADDAIAGTTPKSDTPATITFDQVLLANGGGSSVIGKPMIDGATVVGEVVNPLFKGPKLEIQKLRRRHASKRHTGHRQKHTQVKITAINVPGLQVVETAAS